LLAQIHEPYQVEKNEIGTACSAHRGDQKFYKIFVGTPLREKKHSRPFKMCFREIGMEGVNGVVWLRIGTGGGFTGMSLRVP
jgi:hypothetical protein